MFQNFRNEAAVLAHLKGWLDAHAVPYKKNAPGYFSRGGESDLEIYVNGHTIYAELKNRSRPTLAQIATLAQKRSQGYETFLVQNEADLAKLKATILSLQGTNQNSAS